MKFDSLKIDSDWSLFLDRDGVINKKINDGYVLSVNDLDFIPGSLKAISILSNIFGSLFIVTNQQCVGKGLLTLQELNNIHEYMLEKIREKGGRITDIFIATSLEKDKNSMRKPSTGMACQALNKYPEIELAKSFMAGDTLTDMLFGRRSGMKNILINKHSLSEKNMYEYRFNTLLDFALMMDSYHS